MQLIGLAVVLTLGLLLAPLAVEAQQAGKVYRIGWLGITPPVSDNFARGEEARPTRAEGDSGTRSRGRTHRRQVARQKAQS